MPQIDEEKAKDRNMQSVGPGSTRILTLCSKISTDTVWEFGSFM
jgi:hypothetical protein